MGYRWNGCGQFEWENGQYGDDNGIQPGFIGYNWNMDMGIYIYILIWDG